MMKLAKNSRFTLVALVIASLIVYGSLFPFAFHAGPGGNPLSALASTWRAGSENLGNFIGNVFLYVPLGLFGALSSRARSYVRISAIVLLAAGLSVSMELIQFYDIGHVSSCADIYPNVLGAAVGAVGSLIFSTASRRSALSGRDLQITPMLLLLAFAAYSLFPYLPRFDPQAYWNAMDSLLAFSRMTFYEIAEYAVEWLVVAALVEAVAGSVMARRLLGPMIVVMLLAKVVIANNSASAAEFSGGVIAWVSWKIMSYVSARPRLATIAVALGMVVVAERLVPFHFVAKSHPFGVIPFLSFMHGSMLVNTRSFLEKFFLYGSLIWILARAGARLGKAGAFVAIVLFATSLAETHLPGRSAEVTDAVMALIIAALMALIEYTDTGFGIYSGTIRGGAGVLWRRFTTFGKSSLVAPGQRSNRAGKPGCALKFAD